MGGLEKAVEYIRRGGKRSSCCTPNLDLFFFSSPPWTSTGVFPANANSYVQSSLSSVPPTQILHRMTLAHTARQSVFPTRSLLPLSVHIPALSPHPARTAFASGHRQSPRTSPPVHPPSPLRISHPRPPLCSRLSAPLRPAHVTSQLQSLSNAQPHPPLSPPFVSRPLHMYAPPTPHERRPTPTRAQTRLPA